MLFVPRGKKGSIFTLFMFYLPVHTFITGKCAKWSLYSIGTPHGIYLWIFPSTDGSFDPNKHEITRSKLHLLYRVTINGLSWLILYLAWTFSKCSCVTIAIPPKHPFHASLSLCKLDNASSLNTFINRVSSSIWSQVCSNSHNVRNLETLVSICELINTESCMMIAVSNGFKFKK